MKSRDRRRYDMLTRVRNFGTTHGQLFPVTSTAHDAFAAVAAEIAQLEALDVAERAASQASRATRKAAARQALANTLTRASFTARVVARTTPHAEARVPLPLPKDDLELLTLARQLAASAKPCAGQFAAHGLTLAEVEASIATFDQALHQRRVGRDDRVAARAEIAAAFARAMAAVETLDVNVANCLATDPVALVVWKHDRYVRRRRYTAATASAPLSATGPADPVPATSKVPTDGTTAAAAA